MPEPPHRHRAGDRVDDLCRACKAMRTHVIVASAADGTIAQVLCEFCGSRHRYRRGGPAPSASARSGESRATPSLPRTEALVSERERSFPVADVPADLEMMLRRVIRQETGLTVAVPAEKWRGGELVLRPGTPGLQEKSWPIESFFHKVVIVRNRLRVLEQQVNALEIPEDVKIKLQSYITGCYGSLTSFNVLFADPDDRFRGSGGEE
jgi:hypothetical protein